MLSELFPGWNLTFKRIPKPQHSSFTSPPFSLTSGLTVSLPKLPLPSAPRPPPDVIYCPSLPPPHPYHHPVVTSLQVPAQTRPEPLANATTEGPPLLRIPSPFVIFPQQAQNRPRAGTPSHLQSLSPPPLSKKKIPIQIHIFIRPRPGFHAEAQSSLSSSQALISQAVKTPELAGSHAWKRVEGSTRGFLQV